MNMALLQTLTRIKFNQRIQLFYLNTLGEGFALLFYRRYLYRIKYLPHYTAKAMNRIQHIITR